MLIAILACCPLLHAQPAFETNLGLGSAFNKPTGAGIENGASPNAYSACSIASNDGFCQATSGLGGVFMNAGGAVMFSRHFGAGAEFSFQPTRQDYGPLQYRQTFIDGNAVYKPLSKKHWDLQVQGGIGSARTGFSLSQSSCVGTAVCVSQTQAIGAANHFQVHTGAGLQVYLNEHIFLRPQFDLHYIPNFTRQFGRNATPMAMFSIGYSSGRSE